MSDKYRARRLAADRSQVPHGLSGSVNWGCECRICKQARHDYDNGDWDMSRHGQPWTSTEVRLVQRNDVTLRDIARELRRPYKAIVSKRHDLRKAVAA